MDEIPSRISVNDLKLGLGQNVLHSAYSVYRGALSNDKQQSCLGECQDDRRILSSPSQIAFDLRVL